MDNFSLPSDRQTDRQIATRRLDAAERVRLAASPIDLAAGAYDAKAAAPNLLLTLSTAGVGVGGGLLAALSAPYATSNGAVFVLFWAGLAVSGLAVLTAWLTWYIQASGWLRYEHRLDDWHAARLTAFNNAQGQEVERQLSVWEFSDSSPGHMLLLMLAIQQRAEAGEPAPHATRQLEGDVWLRGADGRLLKVGYVSPSIAERAGALFAGMGFIQGRKPKSAGKWVLPEQPISVFVDKWS